MAMVDSSQRRELGALLRSVVKVMTVSDAPDYDQPWQNVGPNNSSGSGAIVETKRGLRVLTNAHCVQDHVYVEVRRYGKARKYQAEVEALGHECDLALLHVPDPTFFAGTLPIPLGILPHLSDQVSVCGYPVGGERLSITQGIVSRIDLVQYAQSQRRLLAVQIDAAINQGNSGGPVLKDGVLIGVAFQSLDDAEKIGYVIAVPVIEHFLEDVENGVYEGFPGLGVATQALESDTHRRALGLPAHREEGVLITRVAFGSSGWGCLDEGDVLLAVDGVPVTPDGTVEMREGEHVDFAYVVSRRHVGETMECRVWRDRSELSVVVRLRPPSYLVPEDRYDVKPTYYVFGGLLFVPLTRNYLMTWTDPWWQNAPRELVVTYEHGVRTPDYIEPVVLQKVLADRVNQGYHEYESLLVKKVQGVPVRSIRHLLALAEQSDDPFVTFELSDGRQMVVDRALAGDRHSAILERFGIPEDRSADLVEHATDPL
jgi:S1-C subfamily serine protease